MHRDRDPFDGVRRAYGPGVARSDVPSGALMARPTPHPRGRHSLATPFDGVPVTPEAPAPDPPTPPNPVESPTVPVPPARSPVESATVPVPADRRRVTAGPPTSRPTPPPPGASPVESPTVPIRRPSVARSALITALSFAVVPVAALVSGPLLARVLGPYERGIMAAVLAPMFVAMFIAAFAIPEATTYAVAKRGVPPRRAAYAGAKIILVSGLITVGILWFSAPIILRGTPEAVPILRQILPCLPLMMYTLVQRFAMSGAGRYGIVGIERTTSALGRVVLLIVFAVFGVLTANTAVWANVASTIAAGLVLLFPLMRTRPDAAGRRALPGAALTRTMLGYGIRGWGGVCANLVNWRLDQAILPAFVGATNLGYYAVAVGLAELPATLIGATKSVVFTETSARANLGLAARAARVILAVTVLVDAVLILCAPFLITLLFGAAFAPAVPLAQLLLVGNVPFTLESILAAGLLAAGRPGLRSIGQIVAAALTLVGIFVLAPLIGTQGAALTSLTAYTVGFAFALGYFCRVSKLRVVDCLVPKRSDLVWAAGLFRRRLRKRRK